MIVVVAVSPFRCARDARGLRRGRGRSARLAICVLPVVFCISSPALAFNPLLQQVAHNPARNSPDDKEGAAETPAEPKLPEVQKDGWRRDRLAWKKGTSKVELTGYLQEDFRYFDWAVSGDPTGRKQAKERELRRFRVGSKAQLGKTLLEFQVEPRHLPPGSHHLKSLNATYAFSKGLSVRAGFFKLPGSREFSAATNNTDFVDRSMIATRLVPERDWGVTAAGVHGRLEYLVGAFKGDGNSSIRRSGPSAAARVAVNLPRGLQLSGSFLEGRVTATPAGGIVAPAPKGAYGQTATGFTFFGRPYVDGTRRTLSTSLLYSKGSFRFLGEYLEEGEERKGQGTGGQDLPDVLGRGVSAQVAYLLTGERKGVLVEPRKSIFHGGLGAVELVARVETLRFDDTGAGSLPASTGGRVPNLAAAGASAVEAGANYWASYFMKLQLTAMWEKYNDPLIAPVPGNRGHYFSILARVQFMIQ